MADERCVFPEDADSSSGSAEARTPDRWLDHETAERLLRGESLDAVDVTDRDQAERLAKTLGALCVDSPADTELPGEAAALAAFREARTDRVDDRAGERAGETATGGAEGRASRGRRAGGRGSDAGLVRIGGPGPDAPPRRRARPVHFGLAAALAVGMVGGVAVAAGTGTLPFGESEPEPAASVSAAVTPDHPRATPSPNARGSEPTPDGDTGQGSPRDTARGGSATPDDGTGADGRKGGSGDSWSGAASACRAVRDGKELSADRRRTLEGAAGGSARVWKYCKGVLTAGTLDEDAGNGGKGATGDQHGENGRNGQEDNEVKDDRGGKGEGDTGSRNGSGEASSGGNHHDANGGFGTPSASASPAPLAAQRASASYGPTPGPSPTYTAL